MRKFCIFCGDKPENKNNEHIIPKWLIKLTGNPNRQTLIGKKNNVEVKFSWLNYKFPSCQKCNTIFSSLEAKVKPVVEKLLNEASINEQEINLLLDWLDKIRIGVWLGQSMLYNRDFEPNFFIKQRVGNKDRGLIIYKSAEKDNGIGITGTETEAFVNSPSVFTLTINELSLFNYSKEFILGENLGFPYPQNYFYSNNGQIRVAEIMFGKEKVSYPILQGQILKPAIRFYQSILMFNSEETLGLNEIKNDYLEKNALSKTNNIIQSKIFLVDEISDVVGFWPNDKEFKFNFKDQLPKELLMAVLASMVLEYQIQFVEQTLNHLSEYTNPDKEVFIYYLNSIISQNRNALSKGEE